MDSTSYKTYSAKPSEIEKEWVLVDAEDKPLGRLCSRIAHILRGKHKPTFTPHMDTGDHVVVINADKVRLTGKKWTRKQYFDHTRYPGGERFHSPLELHEKDPTRLIRRGVVGMLPKNRLGRKIVRNMRIYAGPNHPHKAQNPEKIEVL